MYRISMSADLHTRTSKVLASFQTRNSGMANLFSTWFLAGNQLYDIAGEGDAEDEVPKMHCNFRLYTLSFEPRHENKSCSACPEDQLKPFNF